MKKIKSAIIGSGFMGSAHAEALMRIGGVEIIAIASNDLNGAKKLAEKYNIPNIYEKWEYLIDNKEVEVIHNCTPNYLHYEINKSAILQGKHVISEKPLTINSEQSQELVELVKQKGTINAVNFNYRFYPLVQHLKSIINKGDLGELYFIYGYYLQDWLFYKTDYNWRLETEMSGDSRAIADIGSHWCDLIQFLTGKRIKKVLANLFTIHKTRYKPETEVETFKEKEISHLSNVKEIQIETEDCGTVIFQLEDGINGTFTVSQISAGRKNQFFFEINGSEKSIAWAQEEPNKLWIGYRNKPNEILIKDPSLIDKGAKRYVHYPGGHPEGYPDCFKNLFNEFYDLVRTGKGISNEANRHFATFEDGLYLNKIVEAIIRSNKEKKWINID
ncbi:Gfo/Idh/MocA family oxidoreductase [Ignavibacteria bacterium 4148-Me]|uniref:Gfo/Idh/MocA family protein n=1 Tax=Rosettibacter primus TaxID=3111523 RepID=UPI00336BD60D